MVEMRNILVVDDHPVMRKGMNILLNDFYPSLTVHEADAGDSMLALLNRMKIDLIVLDIQIPGTDTINLVEIVSIKFPETYILVFSMLPELIYAPRLLQAGARGYLSKDSSITEMKKAFSLAIRSKKYVSQNLKHAISTKETVDVKKNPFSQLSFREFEIVSYLIKGNSLSTIATGLNLKPSTVGTYKSRVFEKLNVNNIFELKDLAVLYKLNSMEFN